MNYQAKHTEKESASGLVVLLIISPPDLPTVMGVDLRPEGTCWDFQVHVSWNKELDQGHMDSDKNRDSLLGEKQALSGVGANQKAGAGWRLSGPGQ